MVSQRFRLLNSSAWSVAILASIFFAATQPARAESSVAPEQGRAAGAGTITTGVAATGSGPIDELLSSVHDLRNLGLGMSNDLNENAWDFTDPDSIPGFASRPYHVHSKPEGLD